MFDFERVHQMARDARAKGHSVTKGKRARDLMEEGRFRSRRGALNSGARSKG
jgi:hypothetical protein